MLYMQKWSTGGATASLYPMESLERSLRGSYQGYTWLTDPLQPLQSVTFMSRVSNTALKKPSRTSKTKQHITLERRLGLWSNGDLDELVREGRAIQQRLPKRTTTT